jgi:hypothetical protein
MYRSTMSTTPKIHEIDLGRIVTEYVNLKNLIEKYQSRLDDIKKELSNQVDWFGDVDDKGHKWLPAGEHQLKRERRVSINLDNRIAEQWAKDKNMWDEISEEIRVVSEDKLLGKVWDNPDLKLELDELYVKKESWAFKVVEGKSYGDE